MSARSSARALAALAIAAAVGCKTTDDNRAADDGADTLLKVRAASTVPTRPTSYEVIGTLPDSERRELETLVVRLTNQPILRFRVIGPCAVEATTGVIRGPLDGGGEIFHFEKRDGRWVRPDPNEVTIWRS
jgi:hypothetical protein